MSRKTTYEYHEAGGICRFKVTRTDNDDGSKSFAQFHKPDARSDWTAKAPPWLKPLWNAGEISWLDEGSPVLVVEGEKTAIAAQALLGSRIFVTTWSGGSNAVKKTDWSALKAHRVVVWPDLDKKLFAEDHARAGEVMPFMMQPGTKCALQVATITGGSLVNIPDEFIAAVEDGWDLADELPPGFDREHVDGWIRRAFEALRAQTPPELSGPASASPAGGTGDAMPADDSHTWGQGAVVQGEQDNGYVPPFVPALQDENDGAWRDGLMLISSANGVPKPLFENCCKILEASDRFGLVFDEFKQQIYCTIGERELAVEDEHVLMIARWVQQEGIHASPKTVQSAVLAVAQGRRRHPPREYLRSLKWDGVDRCEMWLIDHAGAQDTELSRAISKKFLIQAVARIMRPGCQADTMMILEGVQGIRKSTLLRTLFGSEWFSDHLPDLGTKDALQQLLGTWCIEVAELSTLARAESAKIKAFISSPVDKFRLPYGFFAKDFPRSCVFAGTSNDKNYLRDFTGGRRFWPIECTGKIDVAAIAASRDQLWAEAVSRYDIGEQWWMEDHLEEYARAAQDERREDDPWEPIIAEYLVGKASIESRDILKGVLGIANGDQNQIHKNRLAKILTLMKWERKQVRIGSERSWVYVPINRLV